MPSVSASRGVQRLDGDERRSFDPLNDELRDPVPLLDLDGEHARVVQVHLNFAPVVTIHHPWGVEDAHAMQRGQPRPGMHKPRKPDRDSSTHARTNQPPLSGKDRHILRCDQVRARVGGVLPLWNLRRLRNDLDVQCVLLHWGESGVVKLVRHRDCPRSTATVLRHDDVRLPCPFVVFVLRVRAVDEHDQIRVLLERS